MDAVLYDFVNAFAKVNDKILLDKVAKQKREMYNKMMD